MSAKLILSFRPTATVRAEAHSEPSDQSKAAELEFVRARARQAARAFFEAELRDTAVTPTEERSCE
jgi:hypothetical protein